MKKTRKILKKRNVYASMLALPIFKAKTVKSKKIYSRKRKHKEDKTITY